MSFDINYNIYSSYQLVVLLTTFNIHNFYNTDFLGHKPCVVNALITYRHIQCNYKILLAALLTKTL